MMRKLLPGKAAIGAMAHEKMTVLGKHPRIISLGKNTETAGFHQRGIRLVKILHLFKGGWGNLDRRRLHIQLIADEGLRIIDAINAEIKPFRPYFAQRALKGAPCTHCSRR